MNFTFNAAALANPGSWFPWAGSSSTVTSPAAAQTAQADQHALANRQMAPDVETFFLMTSAEYLYLSSSIVKEIARLGGDISALAPEPVQRALKARFAREGATSP